MKINKLDKIIKEFSKKAKVLVIGDIMLDHYISGKAIGISPEAPVPIIVKESDTVRPGGAANVACNLSAMGSKCELIGVVGRDSSLNKLYNLLEVYNISVDGLIIEESRPTTLKQRIIANDQQLLRIDFEKNNPISQITLSYILKKIEEKIESISTVIISDYKKGVINSDIIQKLTKHNINVIVDPKGCDYNLYEGAYIIKPNLQEVQDFCNKKIDPTSNNDLMIASKEIQKATKCKFVIITLGDKGYCIYDKNQNTIKQFKALKKEVYDITGAGDSFVAALSAAISIGVNIYDAAAIGNLAGASAVQMRGTYPVNSEMLLSQ